MPRRRSLAILREHERQCTSMSDVTRLFSFVGLEDLLLVSGRDADEGAGLETVGLMEEVDRWRLIVVRLRFVAVTPS